MARQLREPSTGSSPASPGDTSRTTLRAALFDYDELIQRIVPKLPKSEQESILDDATSINNRIKGALSSTWKPASSDRFSTQTNRVHVSPSRVPSSQRYLGEVSDVTFFNLVKRVLQASPPGHVDEAIDSYELDDAVSGTIAPQSVSDYLPSREIADEYLSAYFSTIHIAYPFIQKGPFIKTLAKLRESDSAESVSNSWLATLCMFPEAFFPTKRYHEN